MSELKLDFVVGWLSINSSTGDVILSYKNNRLLHKYTLRQDGSYINQWKRRVPANEEVCNGLGSVYLTDAGDVILQNMLPDPTYPPRPICSSLTHHLDQDMKLMNSWEYDGKLIGCLSGPRAVYEIKKGEGRVAVIRSLDGEVLQLEPPEGTTWSELHDVCEDVKTGKLVVFPGFIKAGTIYVFSQEGKSQHIMHLLVMCLRICKQ